MSKISISWAWFWGFIEWWWKITLLLLIWEWLKCLVFSELQQMIITLGHQNASCLIISSRDVKWLFFCQDVGLNCFIKQIFCFVDLWYMKIGWGGGSYEIYNLVQWIWVCIFSMPEWWSELNWSLYFGIWF